jgi:hypothetical protein
MISKVGFQPFRHGMLFRDAMRWPKEFGTVEKYEVKGYFFAFRHMIIVITLSSWLL